MLYNNILKNKKSHKKNKNNNVKTENFYYKMRFFIKVTVTNMLLKNKNKN